MRVHGGVPDRPEHRWPSLISITAAFLLYLFLPNDYALIPRWILPSIALLMVIPQLVLNPRHFNRETRLSRIIAIALATMLLLGNQLAVGETIVALVGGHLDPVRGLLATLQVWLTDVVAFGVVYWELDRGGPVARRLPRDPDDVQDFRFPQEDGGPTNWRPGFVDYAYFSLSTMMAFSPTDVMPFTARAKGLMALQSLTGFVLLALVIARAVNILGS